MSQMKLYGMQRAYQTLMETGQQHAVINDEAISLLIQSEWEGRKVDRYLKNARFCYQASIEELDFNSSRSLDKTLIMRLAEGSFIKRKEDVLLTCPTGVGKSFLASALGHQACHNG